MWTYLLFIIVLIYLFIVLNYAKGDVFFPGTIVMLVYVLSLSFLLIQMNKWGGNISFESFCIFFLGITTYLIGSIIGDNQISKITIQNKLHVEIGKNENTNSIINLPAFITICVIVLDILILLKYYIDVRNSASSVGSFSSISQMITVYRMAGVYGNLKIGLTKISIHGYSLMMVLAYFYLYIILINLINYTRSKVWIVTNMIPVILYILCSLMTGGRNPIIQILVASLMMFYIIYTRAHGISKRFNKKFTKRLIIIVAITLIAFSAMRGVVGRQETSNTFDYIAMYIGAPIKLFDMFIENPPQKAHTYFGQETFINVINWIGSYTHNKDMTSLVMNKEFRQYQGINLGNVYTAFREYYFDFGILGVIVLSFIHSVFFSSLYRKIKNKVYLKQNKFDLQLIIYAYLSVSLVYFSIDDRFYQKFFSKETFIHFVFMIVLAIILPRIRIGSKK